MKRVIKKWNDWAADYEYYLQEFRKPAWFSKQKKWIVISNLTWELSKAQKWAENYKVEIIEVE